jgi:hypothetical protein
MKKKAFISLTLGATVCKGGDQTKLNNNFLPFTLIWPITIHHIYGCNQGPSLMVAQC